jgi:hypothetical protein
MTRFSGESDLWLTNDGKGVALALAPGFRP